MAGRVHEGHDIQMANGPVIAKCSYSKLQKVTFSIPGAEYMQLRNCAVDRMAQAATTYTGNWIRCVNITTNRGHVLVMCDSSGLGASSENLQLVICTPH